MRIRLNNPGLNCHLLQAGFCKFQKCKLLLVGWSCWIAKQLARNENRIVVGVSKSGHHPLEGRSLIFTYSPLPFRLDRPPSAAGTHLIYEG